MAMFSIPVSLPYRVANGADAALVPVQVQTVASSAAAALAIAQVLVSAHLRLRHQGAMTQVSLDRARVGAAGAVVDGPYAYLLTRGTQILHLTIPARLDQDEGTKLGAQLAGLDGSNLFGVVFDCQRLVYLNSSALASFAAHSERLRLQLCRPTEGVRKVFELVGLASLIPMHDNLQAGLDALVARQWKSG